MRRMFFSMACVFGVCVWRVCMACVYVVCVCRVVYGLKNSLNFYSPFILQQQVFFKTPVNLKDEKVNVWLTNVEKEMKVSLARLLEESINTIDAFRNKPFQLQQYMHWLDSFQAQIVVLSTQVSWSQSVQAALEQIEKSGAGDKPLKEVLTNIEATLSALADTVLLYQPVIRRKKLEQMITELVHQRDVTREVGWACMHTCICETSRGC